MSKKNLFPFFMKATAAGFALATALFAGLYWCASSSILLAIAITCGTTCYHFSMRLLVGYLVPPVKDTASWFRPKKWEAPLYSFLRVKHWKKHLPTYDPRQFSSKEYTPEQIVQHMCGAEVVHEVIIVCSFLPMLIVPLVGEFWVFFLTSTLSALFDSLFVIVQRYNRPRLERIIAKNRH